jgi:hypothetical protein
VGGGGEERRVERDSSRSRRDWRRRWRVVVRRSS